MIIFSCYTEDYEAAREHVERMRNIAPALYNPVRLLEAPIPDVPQAATDEADHDYDFNREIEEIWVGGNNSSAASNQSNAEPIENPLHDTTGPGNGIMIDITSSGGPTVGTADETTVEAENQAEMDEEAADEAADIKPIVPLYRIDRANNDDIVALLDEHHIEVLDDMVITVGSKGYGRPLQTTTEGLVKFEDNQFDDISGNIPFMSTVSRICFNFNK